MFSESLSRSFSFGKRTPTGPPPPPPPPPFYGPHLYLPGDGAGSIAKSQSFLISSQITNQFGIAVKMKPRNYYSSFTVYPPENPEGVEIGPLTNTWRGFPGSNPTIVSKSRIGQITFSHQLSNSGGQTAISNYNGTLLTRNSGGIVNDITPEIPDNTIYWIGISMEMFTGGVTRFYKSPDGVNWSEYNSPIGNFAGTIIDDNTPIRIGARLTDTGSNDLGAEIYRLQIFNTASLSGTPIVDFDPSLYTGGSTLSSVTGQTWTILGNASIVTS